MLDGEERKVKMLRATMIIGTAILFTAIAIPGPALSLEHKFKEYEKTTELGTEKLEGTVGSLRVESTTSTLFIATECTTNTLEKAEMFKGMFEDEIKGTIKAEKCTLYELGGGKKTAVAGCTVKTPVTLTFQGNLGQGTWSPVENYELNSAMNWGTFAVEGGSCALKGSYLVKERMIASLPNGETEQSEHEIILPWLGGATGMFGAEPATVIFTMKIKRTNGKPWYYA